MKGKTRRLLASWLLLAVYLPMLVFSSLHIHENQVAFENDCVACVNHQPHSGHLTGASMSLYHSCVLCQFISLTYIAVAIATVVSFQHVCKFRFTMLPSHVQHGMRGMVYYTENNKYKLLVGQDNAQSGYSRRQFADYTARIDIKIPSDIDEGDFHFMIRLTDRAGWQELKSVSLEIEE